MAAAALGALAVHSASRSGRVSYRPELLEGQRFADSLELALSVLPSNAIPASDAVMALYLERQRLGVGSPFRLIDQALRDSAVDTLRRRQLAFSLLARTVSGQGYQIDPGALDMASPDAEAPHGGPGARHLALIEAAVRRERDPRTGELAVRLAYQLAVATEGAAPRAIELASCAAAQVRDRVLAMRDAQRLIEAAEDANADPFVLLRVWRDSRRFAVERPLIDPLPSRVERAAVDDVPGIVSRIDALAGLDTAFVDDNDERRAAASTEGSLVAHSLVRPGEGIARRMAAIAESRGSPPEAPVTVTVTGYGPLAARTLTSLVERGAMQRFVAMARSEETLAAEFALLRSRLDGPTPVAAAAVLTASVSLRPYAQERAWLPDDRAPGARDLQLRYGVALSFDRDVPTDWRAYLRRNLANALDDFRRVFPAYDPHGLHVHFGDSPLHDRALALHDPVSRTIYFPVASSAGVMAHELAHDLDWLAARHYYGSTVGYRTDRAVRQSTDLLAGALRQMASALRPDTLYGRTDPRTRPTEVFARSVDWFVSASLSREGRMNGYLSAVQDAMLTGYGSAMSPELAHDGGSATLSALDGMTIVPTDLRTWYAARYGSDRQYSVQELVRDVLEAPISAIDLHHPSTFGFSATDATMALFRSDAGSSGAWECLVDAYANRSTDERAARTMIGLAAEARARGVVRRWRSFARHYAPSGTGPLRVFDGPPWNPELTGQTLRDLRDAILWHALAGDRGGAASTAFPAPPGGAALDRCMAGR